MDKKSIKGVTRPEAGDLDAAESDASTLEKRARLLDSYGLLLALIVLSLLASALARPGDWTQLIALAPQAGALLLALHTSGAAPRTFRRAAIAVVVGVGFVVVSFVGSGGASSANILFFVLMGALIVSALVAVVRRIVTHPKVTMQTVLGALCVYLFIGMLFALVYATVGLVGGAPFFAQAGKATGVDYLYFSFITITTVGYGDLTAAGDLGRMLAVTEALIGQIYLVTVVALLVSNIGRVRGQGRGTVGLPADDEEDS